MGDAQLCRNKKFSQTLICEEHVMAFVDDFLSGDSGRPSLTRVIFQAVPALRYEQRLGCARPHHPGVYTKVVKYLSWIDQVMELTQSELSRPVNATCQGHRCPLGECLSSANICNGFVECSDGSDEWNCDH
ncbi:plasminogen-like [Oratosquilla oratoria]|uniref:plasminogen-like n=1 Tax=Oratosquilla oratoria TaxID=337810 RepID=UPI003F761676